MITNVLHLSFSKNGGAGRVAGLISNELNKVNGFHSEFIYKINSDLKSEPFNSIGLTIKSIFDEFVIKKKNFSPLFSITRDLSDPKIISVMKNFKGILHLHWINGIINFSQLLTKGLITKPLVWTFHDMNPVTGGCHNSLSCKNYVNNCEYCPATKSIFQDNVVLNKKLKDSFFLQRRNFQITVPSHWLANKIKTIASIDNENISIIANPVNSLFFEKSKYQSFKNNLGFPPDSFVIGFVSTDINNPLKRFDLLIKILNDVSFRTQKKIALLAIGRFDKLKNKVNFPILSTGNIQDDLKLIKFFSSIDLLASTSISESFGLNIAEAAALGIPSIVLGGTAADEIVMDATTGYIASDPKDFVMKIIHLINNKDLLKKFGNEARNQALQKYTAEHISKNFASIYNKVYSS